LGATQNKPDFSGGLCDLSTRRNEQAMKAIMVMYDSLNRKMLEPYGCDWIPTPNFKRLAERAVTFDCNYVGSMPCMPARRELHTGRYNFLHRSWGPIEPFDDSMPELLKRQGIYTHLTTDHDHYWEDGGATYHHRYSSFDLNRGQEGDPWKTNTELLKAAHDHQLVGRINYFDKANREYINCEERMPQARTFAAGLDFIRKHHGDDNWFLQIETFDPHEPFFTQPEYKEAFAHEYNGPLGDWPPYYIVTEGEDGVRHMRMEYAALITMCDRYLGKVLDEMDRYGLWEDTLLIVNTDHGFLLGEHQWWAKSIMPVYEEISHTPFFIYNPLSKVRGVRRDALTQTIDIPATILDFFGVEKPKDMLGRSLLPVIETNEKIREYALFGYHDGHCNITDGNWVYMKAPLEGKAVYEYTLMPTHMNSIFSTDELKNTELAGPFSFTKGCKVMKIKGKECMNPQSNFGSKLFCLKDDPLQEHPILDVAKEAELANAMITLMKENDAPTERFERYGFREDMEVTEELICSLREGEFEDRIPARFANKEWENGAVNMYHTIMRMVSPEQKVALDDALESMITDNQVTAMLLFGLIQTAVPEEQAPMLFYFGGMAARTE